MMDRDRFERAMHRGPVDVEAYRPLTSLDRPARTRMHSRLDEAALGLVVVAVLIAGLVIWPQPSSVDPAAAVPTGLRTSGRIIFIVPAAPPQALSGGAWRGFDVDVAKAVAEVLDLTAQVEAADPATVKAGSQERAWHVALDIWSDAEVGGTPYFRRDAVVVTRADTILSGVSDLGGRSSCVVDGSAAARWVDGTAHLPAPQPSAVLRRASAAECLDDVRHGTADEFIGDWTFAVGAVGDGLAIAPFIPFTEIAAARVDPAAADGPQLGIAIQRAFDVLRSRGTLTSLSQNRFGGVDLSMLAP